MDYLIDCSADVLVVLEQIKKQKLYKPLSENLVKSLSDFIDTARKTVLESYNYTMLNWPNCFLQTGRIVYSILSEHGFDDLPFARFLMGKHKKYGAKPLLVWRELGILVRLQSKVGRLVNITSEGEKFDLKDETVEDTLKDMLGYCVLGCLLCTQVKEEN